MNDVSGGARSRVGAATGKDRTLEGIGSMVAATLLFCCGDAFIKLMSSDMPTSQLISLRSTVTVVIVTSVGIMLGAMSGLSRALTPAMGLRSVGDLGASVFFVAALAWMPFADITGILQTMPLCLTAISALLLGERVGWRRWSAVAVGLVGALLIAKPGTSAFNVWSVLAFLSVIAASLRDVATRRIDPALSPLLILAVSQVAVASATAVGATFESWRMPSAEHALWLVAASVLSLVGHLCVIHAIRVAEISAAAPFRYTAIVWGVLLGYLVWGEWPDAWSFVGIAVLTAAGLYTLHRERTLRIARPPSP